MKGKISYLCALKAHYFLNISFYIMRNTEFAIKLRASLFRVMALVIMVSCAYACAEAQGRRGEKSFGVKAGYMSRNVSGLAGLVFQYSFSEHVRIAPQVGVVLRHRDTDALLIDVDMQFPFSLRGGRAAIYPLVGVAFNSWSKKGFVEDDTDVTAHINSLGCNAGAGFEYRCSSSLKLSLEGRYTLLRHNPNAQVAAGIAFVF